MNSHTHTSRHPGTDLRKDTDSYMCISIHMLQTTHPRSFQCLCIHTLEYVKLKKVKMFTVMKTNPDADDDFAIGSDNEDDDADNANGDDDNQRRRS